MSDNPLPYYSQFVHSRTKPLFNRRHDILHAAVGLATEAGEALDTAKKVWFYEQSLHDVNKEGHTHATNLIEEAGDILFYAMMLCNALDVKMEEVIALNIKKLEARYPTAYSNEAAKERADKKEPG